MSDQTNTPSGSAPAAPTGGRSTPAAPPAAKKKAPSKAAKVAGGVAAAAAAVAAGLAYGDDIVDAASGDPDADTTPGALGAAGPVGTPLVDAASDGGSASAAPTRQTRRSESDDADAPSARAAAARPAAQAAPSVDAEFEAARATLLARLENFEAPAGTSPEDAAQLRQELIDTVTDFTPSPGQTTEQALAALRNEYDDQLQDFTQDQKIDALVEEAQRDNEADAAAQAGAAVDPVAAGEFGDPDVDPAVAGEVDPDLDTDLVAGEVASNSYVLTADLTQTAQMAPTDAGITQVAGEVPVARGLRDDFDTLVTQPAPAEALGRSQSDFAGRNFAGSGVAGEVAGGSPDVNVEGARQSGRHGDGDGGGLDVSATPQQAASDAVDLAPIELTNVAMAAPASLDHDVLGVAMPAASVADASEPAEMAVVDLGEPIVVDATAAVTEQLEQNQVIDLVEIAVVEPIAVATVVEIEPMPAPVDEPPTEDTDFAAVLANEITPSRPDNLSFEP